MLCVAAFGGALLGVGCKRMALLAPTGSSITLTSGATALPLNGTANLIAQVTEASGTPPQRGTRVAFSTTLGTIEPAAAETDVNGTVQVTFRAGGANGTATITAFSGSATTGAEGAVTIAVGASAVGRVTLSANPANLAATGGSAQITATVLDLNGNLLASAPVTFSTSAGSLASTLASTNTNGIAQTSLFTTTQATVTATVGIGAGGTGGEGTAGGQATATVTVSVSAAPAVGITVPTGTLMAGGPIVFGLSVQPASGSAAQVRRVSVDFGDGSSAVDLGAVTGSTLTVQHAFPTAASQATYTVRATVTDSLGGTTTAATVIVVQPQPPLSVTIARTATPSGGNTIFTLTAVVTPGSATVSTYLWTIDSTTSIATGGSNQLIQTFPNGTVHTLRVDITTTAGATATGTIVVAP